MSSHLIISVNRYAETDIKQENAFAPMDTFSTQHMFHSFIQIFHINTLSQIIHPSSLHTTLYPFSFISIIKHQSTTIHIFLIIIL